MKYQSRGAAIAELVYVQIEIYMVLKEVASLLDVNETKNREEMQEIAETLEHAQSVICDILKNLRSSENEYLSKYYRNHVALTVVGARALIDEFNVLEIANALS